MDQTMLKQFKKLLDEALIRVATKDDLIAMERRFNEKFAAKDDLSAMEKRLIKEIEDSEGFVTANTDKHKADKLALGDLEQRVTKIEHKLFQ